MFSNDAKKQHRRCEKHRAWCETAPSLLRKSTAHGAKQHHRLFEKHRFRPSMLNSPDSERMKNVTLCALLIAARGCEELLQNRPFSRVNLRLPQLNPMALT
jgi:hypothetical protein